MTKNARGGKLAHGDFWVVCGLFVGLVLFSYLPLRVVVDHTHLFRPDWLLGIPVLLYALYKTKLKLKLQKPAVFALVFAIVSVTSFLVNPVRDGFRFVTVFVQLLFSISLFIALTNLDFDREQFRTVLRVWIGLLVVIAVYTVYQSLAVNLGLPFSSLYPSYGPDWAPTGDYSRPVAVFREPSYLTSFLTTGIAVLLPCIIRKSPVLFSVTRQRLFLFTIGVGILVSASFSGYLTTVLALLLLTAIPTLRQPLLKLGLASGLACIAVFFAGQQLGFNVIENLLNRTLKIVTVLTGQETVVSGSIGARWLRYLTGVHAWHAHPVFGVGTGQFEQWSKDVAVHNRFEGVSADRVGSLHGGYIQVLAQNGLLGVFTFTAVWVQILRDLRKQLSVSDGVDHTLTLIATSVIVVLLIDWTYSFSAIHTFRWSLAGLCYGYVANSA